MVETISFEDLFVGPGDHTARPAANTTADGTLYVCTADDVVERSNGVDTWTEWFDPEVSQ